MSYIRTKDGIYKRREDTYIEDNILYQVGYDFGRMCLGEVIKESDTIEELCDEFVLTDKTLPPHSNRDLKEIVMYKTYIAGSRGNIYGAIWTSKGLIYVAKMNDKGKLVLI